MTELGATASMVATLALAARVLGVLLFGAALWFKARHFEEFTAIVARYLASPLRLARYPAAAVVALEAATVLLMLWPQGAVVGAALAVTLLLCFAAAMTIALARGERELDCGCMHSALRQRVRWSLVVRNILMAAAFVPLLASPALVPDGLVVLDGLAGGIVLFVLYLVAGVLIALDDSFAELKRRYG